MPERSDQRIVHPECGMKTQSNPAFEYQCACHDSWASCPHCKVSFKVKRDNTGRWWAA